MTSAEWIAVIAAVGGLVTTVGTVVVLIIKTFKDEISNKMEVIKNSVDGTASKQEAKLNAALEKLEFVSGRLNKEEQKAALLAATTTATVPSVLPVATEHAKQTGDVLGKIDTNTAETAKNTAKTDAAVQDLKEKS